MEMVNMKHTLILFAALAASAAAADFALSIGNPAAAMLPGTPGTPPIVKKTAAVLAVRAENCADPAKVQITATAEGQINGSRQSIDLRLFPGSTPGAYLVSRDWPAQGVWVVSLSGTCAGAKAGALVPIGPSGFLRESSKYFSRSATEAEIQAALKVLEGGNK